MREEVKHVVRRLGHHPSIVLWSGNNENQVGHSSFVLLLCIKFENQSLISHYLSTVALFQDIAVTRGAGAVVDYSVLYDNIIRTTLWEEVNCLY